MSRMTQLQTFARLGLGSIARVATYRLGLKSGRHPVQRLTASVAMPPFFRPCENAGAVAEPNGVWDDSLWWFSWYRAPLTEGPPDWFINPFSEESQPDATRDWWRIPDFGAGDIKGLWELSRFDWVVAWATKAAEGDAAALERLNQWLADWAGRNPPYRGPNWKCGQESSIRVMHLVTAAWILGQDRAPESGLVDLLRTHLQRIAPTMSYAIGQQNNHGTSEAAALFIGGSFLAGHDPRAEAWARKGRRWLEERAATLIEPDGTGGLDQGEPTSKLSFESHFLNMHTVHGEAKYLPYDEEHPLQPTNPYGRTKYFIEEILRDWAASWKDASAVLLRYFNPVGADASGRIGEDPNGIPNNLVPYISQVAFGRLQQLIVFGADYDTRDGTGVRDYIHVDDLARAHLAAIQFSSTSTGCEAINVGTGRGATVLEMVKAFEHASGRAVPYKIGPRRDGDVACSLASVNKAERLLGWKAKLDVVDMCRTTWNWQTANPSGYVQD